MTILRCAGGCGEIANPSWLTVTIEVSPGPRERLDGSQYWSTQRMTARGQPLCQRCLFSPEWSGVMRLIESDAAEPAPTSGRSCIVICQHRAPIWWRRLFPSALVTWPGSGRGPCPGCHRPANIWGAKSAPIAVTDLADQAISRRRSLAQWARYMAAEIYHGPEIEASEPVTHVDIAASGELAPELEAETQAAIETGREGP